jgi:hypothetical protein
MKRWDIVFYYKIANFRVDQPLYFKIGLEEKRLNHVRKIILVKERKAKKFW